MRTDNRYLQIKVYNYRNIVKNKVGYLPLVSLALGCLMLLGLVGPNNQGSRLAAAAEPGASCDSLIVVESEDKNFHIFSASATPINDSVITGYIFDFGDNQSYEFNYNQDDEKWHGLSTVNHTYSKAGRYKASATVVTNTNGESLRATSEACTTTITIGPAELPTVGSEPLAMESFGVVTLGTMSHHFFLLRRRYRRNRV